MIKVKQLFEKAGIEDVRPTDRALRRMGISRRRFTQLSEGTNKTALSLSELVAIKRWVKKVTEIDPEKVISISEKRL